MAATYAALLALARSLREILSLQQYVDPLHKELILSLREKVDFIVTFLEDYSDKYQETFGRVGHHEIRKAAYEAQDLIDSYYCSVSTTDDADGSSPSEANGDEVNLDRDLTMASERIGFILGETMKMNNSTDTAQDLPSESYSFPVDFIDTFLEDYSDKYPETLGRVGNRIRNAAFERIGFIWEETMKMNNSDTTQDLPSVSYSSSPVDLSFTAKKMVVGFDDDLIAIKQRLYEDAAQLQIIPIVGMGGIGKTTLARRAYEDSILSDRYFDICAWITMSQEYQRREIFLGLLKSLKNEQSDDKNEAELAKLAYQNLIGRRYLIVVDDIWSAKAWDDLKMIFPDDGNGSRILLTTRILDVATYLGSSDTLVHQMKCLSEDQSWKLLQERIFWQQSCPLQLVEVGKKIAKNCGGLPLTIVVVAGLLLSMGNNMNEELWENVAENISSREPIIALQCCKILCFSYDRLPLRLKPCFLYIAAFPEDSEIDVSKLIKLWVAEGLLKPNDQFTCLEDVGERYLEDLVKRSLLLVSKKGLDGKLETVGIHDMLREICIIKAKEEGFLNHHHVSSKLNLGIELIKNSFRRLKIHCTENFDQQRIILHSSTRSILVFPQRYHGPRLYPRSRHVCILDAPHVTWPNISHLISTSVNLRYFAFALDYASCPHGLPASISKHPNLETIVVHCRIYSSRDNILLQVPYEILKMPKLRHLMWNTPFRLSFPSDIGIVQESDLQTIETVINFTFSEEIIRLLVNLKKFKVEYHNMENSDDYNLDNLFHLQKLEDLKIYMSSFPDPSKTWSHAFPMALKKTWSHAFPMALKKLSLEGVPFPWENMTIIGSLPNLQVLEMMKIEVTKVSEWTTEEGEFLQLKYFRSSLDFLARWETEKEHFPSLETLILERAGRMNEIPSGIGEIDTLQYIELRYCKKSLVDSAKRIQKHQHENGNDAFRVCAIDYKKQNVLF